MTLTPFGESGAYTDNELMSKCIIEPFVKDAPEPTASKEKPTSTKASSTKKPSSTKESSTGTSTSLDRSESTSAAAQTSAESSSETSTGAASEDGDGDDAATSLDLMGGSFLMVLLTSAIVGLRLL